MKMIREYTEDVSVLTEEVVLNEGAAPAKRTHLSGIFMQAEKGNRNGRYYPRKVMEKALKVYQREWIGSSRSIGELNHPESPAPNPERASHLITSLTLGDDNNVMGKARILESMPMGKLVKNLIDEGVKMGVSSRGIGTLKEKNGFNIVQDDFYLSTVDVVSDPSAQDAFVDAIMENREWFYENGIFKKRDVVYEALKIDESKALDELAKFLGVNTTIAK